MDMNRGTAGELFVMKGNTACGEKVIVAVKQGNLLATAFHPELTADTRWHSFFLKMGSEIGSETSTISQPSGGDLSFYERPKLDLPIFQ